MHPSRKFTDQQEQKIAKRYLDGESQRTLAKSLGVSKCCIQGIMRRQRIQQRTQSECSRKYQVNEDKIDIIDCEWKAYFLGLLYADGCIHKRSLIFSQKWQDRILVERLKAFLKSEHPIKQDNALCNGKRYLQARLFVTERHLAETLKAKGVLPDRPRYDLVINAVPQPLYHHFIRGYFDGDGSAHSKPGLSFAGNKDFLEWIKAFLIAKDASRENAHVAKHTTSNIHYLRYPSRLQALPVTRVLYQGATTFLERKKEIVDSW